MGLAGARGLGASLCFLAAAMWLSSTHTAIAQTTIGSATEIERNVSGTFAGRTRSLAIGDGVIANENITTASASSAALQFLDQTTLTIGPTSSVVLDRFVYNPDRSVREGTVDMAVGAARWVGSGTRSDDAYRVRTPHAVIGVRGTVFELVVERQRTIVTLRAGAIVVCMVGHPNRCISMSAPDSVVVVTSTDIRQSTASAPSQTQFAENCLSAVDRRLSSCATQEFAGSLNTVAANVAVPTGASFSGFYVGANVGYSSGVVGNSVAVHGFTADLPFEIEFPGGNSSLHERANGAIGGLELGYNWRLAPLWLAGIETDIQGSGQKGSSAAAFAGIPTSNNATACAFQCTYSNTSDVTAKVNWFGTARARAGADINGLWLYGTGGVVYGEVAISGANSTTLNTLSSLPAVYATPLNTSTTKVGWVAGAGVEGRLGTSKWSWKVEYLHVDLGPIGARSLGALPVVDLASTRVTDEIVRLGVNYQLY
jgi:hypothetical protein